MHGAKGLSGGEEYAVGGDEEPEREGWGEEGYGAAARWRSEGEGLRGSGCGTMGVCVQWRCVVLR